MKKEKLQYLLVELATRANQKPVDSATERIANEMMSAHGLLNDVTIPDWFLTMIKSVVERQEVAQTEFDDSNQFGDIFGFTHSFSKFLDVEIEDEGEILMIDFPKLGTQLILIWMGNTYEVSVYDLSA